MANADLTMPQAEFDAKSIPELYVWLKQHGIKKSSIKSRSRKLNDIQKADRRSGLSKSDIVKAKAKYVKLAKLDADVLKTMSLDDLKQKAAAAIGFDPDSPEAESLIRKRKRDWDKFEKDVAAGIRALFQNGFYVVNGKKLLDKYNKQFNAEQVGGAKQSDVIVTHNKQSFFVECKLAYESAQYFKFGVQIKNGKFIYDSKFFMQGDMTDDEKHEVSELFKRIDLSKLLNDIANDKRVAAMWKQFNDNLKQLAMFLKTDPEFKDFSRKLSSASSFPDDFARFSTVFDSYRDEYIRRFNNIVKRMCSLIESKKIGDMLYEEYSIDPDDTSEEVYESVASLIAYVDQETFFDGEDEVKLIFSDKKLYKQLGEEARSIEAKFNHILESMKKPEHDWNALMQIKDADKLQYFYQFFISSVGRKSKGASERAIAAEDQKGNMSILAVDGFESKEFAKAICDYYLTHGHCHYIQVDDCIYMLDRKHNALGLSGLPQFIDAHVLFNIDLHVSDDLKHISFRLFACKPDQQKVNGRKYSFRESDENYVGKKHKKVLVQTK